MCQIQGQTIYTRNARTRTVAIKLNMPNPFFALALGLCTQANSTRRNGGRHPFVPPQETLSPALAQWSFSARTKREQTPRPCAQ
jgi:hypothetical protein